VHEESLNAVETIAQTEKKKPTPHDPQASTHRSRPVTAGNKPHQRAGSFHPLRRIGIMKALIIRSPWIDLILSGAKTWEMRTRPVTIRGRIGLIKAKSGLIYGTAELVDCMPALSLERMRQTQAFHGIPEDQIASAIENRWTTPWVLRDVVRLETPKPYIHRSGAVTWVEIPDEHQSHAPETHPAMKPSQPARGVKETKPPLPAPRMEPSGKIVEWVDIPLSGGNIRNGHFYLRSAERLLPSDCIGGSNKAQAGQNIRVRFEPGMSVETDIAGDKMILRTRGQVRDFYERAGAKEGDCLRFGRVDHHDFVVTLRRATETSN
jgi:hypothetical protein